MNPGYQPYYFDRDLSDAKAKSQISNKLKSKPVVILKGVEPLSPDMGNQQSNNSDFTAGDDSQRKNSLNQIKEEVESILLSKHEILIQETKEKSRQEGFVDGMKDGFEAGKLEGMKEGETKTKKTYHNENEEQGLHLLEKIERELMKLSLTQDEWFGKYAADVADLVSSIMKRLVPAYTLQHGSNEISTFVQQVLGMVVDKPRMEILLPRQSENMATEIKALMNKAGAGLTVDIGNEPVAIRVDRDLNPGECVVRWQGGSVERRMEGFWKDIDAAIKRMLVDSVEVS